MNNNNNNEETGESRNITIVMLSFYALFFR
jgi:hypothetical protein